MYLIAGLGNPGKEYEGTRHNIGFCVLDALADELDIDVTTRKSRAFIGTGRIGTEKVILVKPQTYMNLSGESIRPLMDYYRIPADHLIVIYDDAAIKEGELRIRLKGSAGGHNGMKSIIAHLGTQEFIRFRIGIGQTPARMDIKDHVLGHFNKAEKAWLEDAVSRAVKAAIVLVNDGEQEAMNRYSGTCADD